MEHLHKEINGTSGKCPIAHRDIKSKNILVKSNGECVIADLGLAIRFDTKERVIDSSDFDPTKVKVGTKRYMSPEILSDTLDPSEFVNFCRSDIYSLGLVFWEMLRRTRLTSDFVCFNYQPPYGAFVDVDPSIEQLKVIVVDRSIRPQFDLRIR